MRLLVHLHIHYYNQISYFLEKLSNISGYEWDLFITEAHHDKNIEPMFSKLGVDTYYLETDNIGYDIWPFIKVIKSVDLDKYDLVIKLHTKNRRDGRCKVNGIVFNGYSWRNELVNSLLRTRKHFRRLVEMFTRDSSIGLICSDLLYCRKSPKRAEDNLMLSNEIERLGLHNMGDYFCAGTMFMARISIYRFLQSDKVSCALFSSGQSCTGATDSMSHVYERILSMISNEYSYKTKTVITNILKSIFIRAKPLLQPVFTWTFSLSRIGKKGTKYLTIFGMKFRLSKNPD